MNQSFHTFHIPVMGTGFTIDTPIRIARFGISSVISLGDDILIEKIRKHYCEVYNKPFTPIREQEADSRARRMSAYLNLIDEIVNEQIAALKAMPFEEGNELYRYFELLPDSELKNQFVEMNACADSEEKSNLQNALKEKIVPGSIDVNIMVKIDGEQCSRALGEDNEQGIARSAMRGFASSCLDASVVLSAGVNRALIKYMRKFDDFYADSNNLIKKRIIVKVSDYRSALIQGRMLSRNGLWPSEFRIESGINCGGHAFPTNGILLGPILEEFKTSWTQMENQLKELYAGALKKSNKQSFDPPPIRFSVQGGVNTADEHNFLINNYNVDTVGWGTPFLLVPEATAVDDIHVKKLASAGHDDINLSENSPLGLPFWNLKISQSESIKNERVQNGAPGSPCPKGFLAFDNEFSGPALCRAANTYQAQKSQQVIESDQPEELKKSTLSDIYSKACLCMDLAAGALNKLGISEKNNTAICCGPGMAYFDKVMSLEEIINHIYGKKFIDFKINPPHFFIKELSLYIEYWKKEFKKNALEQSQKSIQSLKEYIDNLIKGIDYYLSLASMFETKVKDSFVQKLEEFKIEISGLLDMLPAAEIKSA